MIDNEGEWGAQNVARNLREQIKRLTQERDEARDWVRRLTSTERVLTCVYCGEAYPPGTPDHGAEVLTAHVRICAKHPMRESENEVADIRERAEFYAQERDEARASRLQFERDICRILEAHAGEHPINAAARVRRERDKVIEEIVALRTKVEPMRALLAAVRRHVRLTSEPAVSIAESLAAYEDTQPKAPPKPDRYQCTWFSCENHGKVADTPQCPTCLRKTSRLANGEAP